MQPRHPELSQAMGQMLDKLDSYVGNRQWVRGTIEIMGEEIE